MEICPRSTPWYSLWVTALLSLLGQLALSQFFSWGEKIPLSLDINPANLWKFAYHFPPSGRFLVLNWLGVAQLPLPLNPFSLAANLPPAFFFTAYTPVMATFALLAMAAFLRELGLTRPAALFGAVIYAWQGDILPFVFPGHYAYIATWPFFAVAAWAALRAERTGQWAYPIFSGAACGVMIGLQQDRAAIASLLVAALYLAPVWRRPRQGLIRLGRLALCAGVALAISFASFLALFQSNIIGVKLGGEANREEAYKYVVQYSLGPEETLTYLVPGLFGWYTGHAGGPYWGRIGQWPDWPQNHQGQRNLNLAISTTGTVATVLAMLGMGALWPRRRHGAEPGLLAPRTIFYARVLALGGFVALVLSWGDHTPLYHPLYALPLMDKWRNPLKWLEITHFALVVLAAVGLEKVAVFVSDGMDEKAKKARRRGDSFLAGLSLVLLLALVFFSVFPGFLGGWLGMQGYASAVIEAILTTLRISLIVALGSLGLFWLWLWVLPRLAQWKGMAPPNPWLAQLWRRMLEPGYRPAQLACGLAFLSVAQLGWVATHFILPTDLRQLTDLNPLVQKLSAEGDQVRVSVAAQDPTLNFLLQNQFSLANISCLEISAASRIPDDLGAFLGAFPHPARLWFLAGVKNVVWPRAELAALVAEPAVAANLDHVEGYTLQETPDNSPSHGMAVLRDYLAKATFIPGSEVLDSTAILRRLGDPAWNPRQSVLLEKEGPAIPFARTGSLPAAARVDLRVYTPQKIVAEVEAPASGYLLINDQYDPDWRVRVNGAPVPLLRADYLFRAVPLPAGKTEVTLSYRPRYRVAGLNLPVRETDAVCDIVMLLAWLGGGAALFLGRPRIPVRPVF